MYQEGNSNKYYKTNNDNCHHPHNNNNHYHAKHTILMTITTTKNKKKNTAHYHNCARIIITTQQSSFTAYHVSKNVRFLERELKTAYDSPVRSSIDVVIWELCATAMRNYDIRKGDLILWLFIVIATSSNSNCKDCTNTTVTGGFSNNVAAYWIDHLNCYRYCNVTMGSSRYK